MSDQAEIIIDGKSYKFPVVVGSEGEKAIIARIKKAERSKLSGLPSATGDHSGSGWML